MIFLLSISAFTSTAQKMGYVDIKEIILSMPESATADSLLEVYRQNMYDQIQNMQKEFQDNLKTFMQDSSNLSAVKKDVKTQELRDEHERLIDFKRDIQQRIAQKETALWRPLIKKAKNAIKLVAKSRGYIYIMNNYNYSNNIPFILKKPGQNDLTNAVKIQLNIK